MEAPDKIYVNPDLDCLWTDECPGDVEYIRKDTLLEWVEAEIELSKRVECVSEESYEEGRQQVAQNLIDKLNSM